MDDEHLFDVGLGIGRIMGGEQLGLPAVCSFSDGVDGLGGIFPAWNSQNQGIFVCFSGGWDGGIESGNILAIPS